MSDFGKKVRDLVSQLWDFLDGNLSEETYTLFDYEPLSNIIADTNCDGWQVDTVEVDRVEIHVLDIQVYATLECSGDQRPDCMLTPSTLTAKIVARFKLGVDDCDVAVQSAELDESGHHGPDEPDDFIEPEHIL